MFWGFGFPGVWGFRGFGCFTGFGVFSGAGVFPGVWGCFSVCWVACEMGGGGGVCEVVWPGVSTVL